MSSRFRLFVLSSLLLAGACSSAVEGGSGGATVTGGATGGGAPTGGAATGGKTSTGGSPATGGIGPSGGASGTGGMKATGGVSGTGGAKATGGAGGGATGTGGIAATGGATATRDHCVDGYLPDPSDETMKDGPADYVKNGQTDTTVQPEVLKWMADHVWESAHFQWHNIRRCKKGMVDRTRDGNLDPCKSSIVPTAQEGDGADDGLQFLAMHRHMIQSLKQLFPKHSEQFEGWDTFPSSASQIPAEWKADWTPFTGANASNGAKADDPMSHLTEMGFATEGDFGQWIQSTSGLHGALHFKWVRTNNQDHGLGNQFVNIDNYMFWKMHGWIDKVWDKYRAARGKKPTDPDIKAAVLAQCRHMDDLAKLVKPGSNTDPGTCTTPPPTESNDYATKIRPIFENARNSCTGCHGKGGMANLTLGGDPCLKSSDIVKAIVGKASTTGGQLKLIEPGNADKSWLYRKVAGTAASAGCTPTGGNTCTTDTMPQGAGMVTLTQTELDTLKSWINAGAN